MGIKVTDLNSLRALYTMEVLDKETPLIVDNDSTYLYHNGEQVFEMHPEDMLREALKLLGIPYIEA